MKYVFAVLAILLCAVPARAQQESAVSYTLTVSDSNNQVVSAVSYPANVLSCGRAKPSLPIIPPTNPTTVYFDDPNALTLSCLFDAQVQLLAVPNGSNYTGSLKANGPTLTSLPSLPSNRFVVLSSVPPPIPTSPRVPSGVRIR